MNGISLSNVNLHYASVAFRERSLKKWAADVLSLRSSPPRLVDIHALKNINVNIDAGERVGLIGSNGAGKSTFLKMLAGLYPISSGKRVVRGTVRSLFDLSLGFEPDATGRENILYRGLLLGLSPRFVRSIEQEIVNFADIGEFIDYPLRTYSAGMQVRLAFAISTAVSGDILLLDEVLGAGDAAFMLKAKRRIFNLVQNSETLVVASHDMTSLASLCTRGLLINRGEIVFDGPIEDVIARFQRQVANAAEN